MPRPRLIERLNRALQLGHRLSLISAPAGYGKTTLVSESVASCERPAAWLSLNACLSGWPLRVRPCGFMVLGHLGAVPLSAIQMGLKSDCAMCATSPESMATRALGVKRIGMVERRG